MLVTGRRNRRRLGREAEVIQNFFCRSRLFYPCDQTYGPTTSFGVCTIMRYLTEEFGYKSCVVHYKSFVNRVMAERYHAQ